MIEHALEELLADLTARYVRKQRNGHIKSAERVLQRMIGVYLAAERLRPGEEECDAENLALDRVNRALKAAKEDPKR